jgi:hypothetical protein
LKFLVQGAQKHKKGFSEKEDDEHTISCIVSLFVNLEENGKLWTRVLEKVREDSQQTQHLHKFVSSEDGS